MKKFIVDTGKKKYSVEANDAEHAVKLVKKIDDEASQLQTVNALIEDEKAAVEAYDVAIENLCGKIPEESIQAIIAIRDDENRHIENLQAVVNGTVTEKNLEDSMMNDFYNKFEKETDIDFLTASLSEMRRYERNWNYEGKKNAGCTLPELRQSIKFAEKRLQELKNKKDSMMNDEEFIISKNGVPLDFWHPNDLATGSGSLQNIIKFNNNSYMMFSNEGEAKDMLSTIKRDILNPSNVERWSKSYPATKEKLLSLLSNLKVTKIKDAVTEKNLKDAYGATLQVKHYISQLYGRQSVLIFANGKEMVAFTADEAKAFANQILSAAAKIK